MSRTRLIVSVILIVILGMIAAPASWAGGLKPATAVLATAGGTPQSVAVGDIDGDGFLDLVIASNTSPGKIDIYYGDGTGAFPNHQVVTVGNGAVAVAIGNLAKSVGGHAVASMNDIVVANSADNSITVLLNGSASSGTYPQTFNASTYTKAASFVGTTPVALAIADFDGLTGLDIAVVNQADNSVNILTNNDDNTFSFHAPITVPGTTPTPTSIVAGTFGAAPGPASDFAVGTSTTTSVIRFLNSPAMTFTPQTAITFASAVVAMTTGKLNTGNDIAVATAPDISGHTVHVLINAPAGTYTDTPYVVGTTAPTGIVIGDFNVDGSNDLAVSNSDANGGVTLIFNAGAGAFTPASARDYPAGLNGAAASGLAIGAGVFITGGRIDVAVTNAAPQVVPLFGTPFADLASVAPAGAVEGAALSNIKTATFTHDADGNTTITATDNWGDGASAGTVNNLGGTNYDVTDSHTYTEDTTGPPQNGTPYNFSVDLKDNAVAPVTASTPTVTVAVADAALTTPVLVPDPVVTQASKTLNTVVAKFHDANTGAPATDFDTTGSTIDYGDGTTGTCSSSGGSVNCTIAAAGGGDFTVTGNHTYAADGNYKITVNIQDEGGSTVGPLITHASITQMSVSVAMPAVGAIETQATGTIALGQFTSGRGGAKDVDFKASINWGDGNTDTCVAGSGAGGCSVAGTNGTTNGNIVAVGGGGGKPWNLFGNHTYNVAAPTTKTITVTVTDPLDGSSTVTLTGTATITEAPLVKDNVAVATQFATEGAAAATFNAGVFWDEDTAESGTSNYTVKINWGDGTSDTAPSPNVTVTGPTAGTDPSAKPAVKWVVTGKHSYAEGGKDACGLGVNPAVCNITVNVTDTHAGGSSITTNASVVNVSDATLTGTNFPISAGVVNVTSFSGTVATWVDNNPLATDLTDYPAGLPAVSIDFKDGTVINCSSGGNAPIAPPALAVNNTCEYFLDNTNGNAKTVVAKHIYTATVTQTVITINDKGGASATVTDTVTLTSISSTTPVTNVPVVEGVNMTPDLVGTFVSQRTGAVAADFNVAGTSINWGDGSPTVNAPNVNLSIVQNPPGACPCTFEVHGTHAFATLAVAGPVIRSITVNVKDNVDSSTATINSTASESDAGISQVAPPVSPLAATEGVKIAANTVVGRFLDANPAAVAGDYSDVVVHWNDPNNAGATSKLSLGQISLVPVGGSPGEFDIEVAGANGYQYREVSNPTVTFDVTDKGGVAPTALAGVMFNVADNKPLVGGAPLAIDKNNGGGLALVANQDVFHGNNGLVATFTDPNPFALVGDFTVSIDWGDGSAPDTGIVSQPLGVGTTFDVAPPVAGHTFLKAGTLLTPVLVTITDNSDNTNKITVNDGIAKVTSLINPVFQNINVTEGTPYNGSVGTFDSSTNSSSFTVNITWGDGNVNAATSVTGGPTTWTVNGTNTYAEETPHAGFCGAAASCPISISVKDNNDGSTLTITGGSATVADAAIAAGAVGPIAGSFTEGNSTGTVTVGTFTDANPFAPVADFPPANVTIHWGDGNTSAGTVVDDGCVTTALPPYFVTPCAAGAFHLFSVTGSNIYAEGGADAPGAGLYNITLDVKDIGGSLFAGFAASSIQINDAPLTSLVVNTLTGGSGQGGALVANVDTFNGAVATFHDGNPSAPFSDFSGNIAWGDGTNTPFTSANVSGGGGNYTISASHMFTKAGTQLTGVTVTVNDVGGASATTVGAAANVTSLHLPVSANIAPTEGVLFSGGAGSFTATTGNSNFSATINWGDGNINNATGFTGGPTWTVNGSNMYTDEDPITCGAGCPITITVHDNTDGSNLTISGGKANVIDAALGAVPVPTIVAAAGQPLNNALAGQFQDANTLAPVTDFSGVIVHWNDPNNPGATSPGTLVKVATPAGQPTQFQILASYVGYAINGTYGVTFDVVDKGGSKIVGGTGVTVTNAPGVLSGTPKNLTPASGVITGTVIANFTNTNPVLPVTDYSGTVNWGDGTPTQACSSSAATTPSCFYTATAVPGTFNVIGSHTYLLLGQTFPITVVVNDAIGGSTVTINSSANIPNVVLTDYLGSTSPPQSLIKAGQSVDVLVTVSPNPNTPPFATPVQFTGCTILSGPALTGLTCAFNPTSVPNVLQVYQVHVTVQSFATVAMQTAPPRPGNNGLKQLALLLPGFVGLFGMVLLGGTKKNRRRTALWFGAGFLLLALLLVGCGGGAGLVTPTGGGASTVPGTYILQINTSDGAAVAPCSVTGTGPCLTAQVTVTQ